MTHADGHSIPGAEPPSSDPRTTRLDAARRVPAALALPTVLASVAFYFLLGDLGVWSDDYAFCQRDHTGAIESLLPRHVLPFRPLLFIVTAPLVTALWNAPWALHLVPVIAHVLAVFALHRLLKGFGLTPIAAAAAALLALTSASTFEVAFWASATCTGLATAATLAAMRAYQRFCSSVGRAQWRWAAATLLLAAAAPCLNEQPATMLGLLPLVWWATPRSQRRARGLHARALAAAALAVCIAYLLLIFQWAPVGHRASIASLAPPDQWIAKLPVIRDGLTQWLLLRDFGPAALVLGLDTLAQHPARTAVFAALLCVSAVAWILSLSRGGIGNDAESRAAARRVALLGVAAFIAVLLPVLLVTQQIIEPRLAYAPVFALAITLAGLIGALGSFKDTLLRRLARAAVLLPLILWCSLQAVLLVGIQSAYRARSRLDATEARALRSAIPDPPIGSVLVPVRVDSTAVRTGYYTFDNFFRGALDFAWSAPPFVRAAYRRDDITATYNARWQGRVIGEFRHDGLHYWAPIPSRSPAADNRYVVPWSGLVPFHITADSRVHPLDPDELRALAARRPIPIPR